VLLFKVLLILLGLLLNVLDGFVLLILFVVDLVLQIVDLSGSLLLLLVAFFDILGE
jgi:hypothetical protein